MENLSRRRKMNRLRVDCIIFLDSFALGALVPISVAIHRCDLHSFVTIWAKPSVFRKCFWLNFFFNAFDCEGQLQPRKHIAPYRFQNTNRNSSWNLLRLHWVLPLVAWFCRECNPGKTVFKQILTPVNNSRGYL